MLQLFYVLEHTEGQLPGCLLCGARVKPRIECYNRSVLDQSHFNDELESGLADHVAFEVNGLDVFVVCQRFLEALGEPIAELVAHQYDLS